jgi:penicillin-insensitive murein endopeptidase
VRAHWLAAILCGAAQLVLALPRSAAADSIRYGSISCGAANRGALAAAQVVPDQGNGFVSPEPWRSRGLRYATGELVDLIERAAGEVARAYAGSLLGVADLSARQGGPVARHASHQSGRDADLIYYAIDRAGDPFTPDRFMAYYGADARATTADSPEPTSRIDERYFDLARNWALVAALASDTDVRVTRIFVSTRVRDWLLAYARAASVPAAVLARVQSVLSTARDTGSHQDHMHVRIGCSADDVAQGRCTDESAAPPRRRRGKRGKRSKRVKPHRFYAHVRCVDPRAVAGAPDHPMTPLRPQAGGYSPFRAQPAAVR